MHPNHTFGGSALDRHIFEYEVDPVGGDAPAGDVPAEPAADSPAEPAWAPSQDEWTQLAGAVGYLAQLEQQRAQVYQPQQQGDRVAFDPFADNPDELLRQVIREELAPFAQTTRGVELASAEEAGMGILAEEAAKIGEFDQDIAWMRAERLLPQMNQLYGVGPQAAEAALRAAAAEQQAYERQQNERAVAQYTNHLETLSGAPGEPGSTYAQGVQQRTMPDYRKGGRVTDRFFGPGSGG